MRKRITVSLAVICLLMELTPMAALASESSEKKQEAASEYPAQEQAAGTSQEDQELDLVQVLEERFGIEFGKEDAKKLVDVMERLEDMGFSVDYVVEKAESLYQEYGAEFTEHLEETVTGVVKKTVSDAVSSFFENLVNSVKDFFTGLFS